MLRGRWERKGKLRHTDVHTDAHTDAHYRARVRMYFVYVQVNVHCITIYCMRLSDKHLMHATLKRNLKSSDGCLPAGHGCASKRMNSCRHLEGAAVVFCVQWEIRAGRAVRECFLQGRSDHKDKKQDPWHAKGGCTTWGKHQTSVRAAKGPRNGPGILLEGPGEGNGACWGQCLFLLLFLLHRGQEGQNTHSLSASRGLPLPPSPLLP